MRRDLTIRSLATPTDATRVKTVQAICQTTRRDERNEASLVGRVFTKPNRLRARTARPPDGGTRATNSLGQALDYRTLVRVPKSIANRQSMERLTRRNATGRFDVATRAVALDHAIVAAAGRHYHSADDARGFCLVDEATLGFDNEMRSPSSWSLVHSISISHDERAGMGLATRRCPHWRSTHCATRPGIATGSSDHAAVWNGVPPAKPSRTPSPKICSMTQHNWYRGEFNRSLGPASQRVYPSLKKGDGTGSMAPSYSVRLDFSY